jgi:hypothetical protein
MFRRTTRRYIPEDRTLQRDSCPQSPLLAELVVQSSIGALLP